MATAPSNPSPTQQHSPRAAVEGSASSSSPSRRLGSSGAVVASPWNQIVRGGGDLESSISSTLTTASLGVVPPPPASGVSQEQIMITSPDGSPTKAAATATEAAPFSSLPEDATEAQSDGTDNGSGGNNASKKPAWSKPSKGGTEVGPVMGALSWPALSESTRPSPKSSSDSLKTHTDISISAPQTIQGSGIASPTPNKQGNNSNANPSSTPNHAPYNRQRSMKRNSGNSSNSIAAANGGFSQLPSPRGSGGEMTSNNSGRHGNSGSDSSSRENTHRDGGQRGSYGSQSHGGNEHHQQRNSYRRGNGGTHPRGDGSHHHGYGGRRGDQDRANQDWNQNRGFGGRDTHMQPQRVPSRPFMRGPPPPGPAPFMPPPLPVRPFGGAPLVYPDVPSPLFYVPGPHPESVRAVPLIPPMAPIFYTLPDPQLHTKIVNQIEYYFSNENLIKDTYLRQNMDEQGWVPIKLIASFKKVTQLTDDIQLILDAVRSSSAVEVEGEKVRRRTDWMRWLMPPPVQYVSVSSPQSIQKSSEDRLSANLQSVSLDDKSKHYVETYLSPSSSGEWSSHSQQFSGEKSNVAFQGGFATSGGNSSK